MHRQRSQGPTRLRPIGRSSHVLKTNRSRHREEGVDLSGAILEGTPARSCVRVRLDVPLADDRPTGARSHMCSGTGAMRSRISMCTKARTLEQVSKDSHARAAQVTLRDSAAKPGAGGSHASVGATGAR
jgi:hypothetical protein